MKWVEGIDIESENKIKYIPFIIYLFYRIDELLYMLFYFFYKIIIYEIGKKIDIKYKFRPERIKNYNRSCE